MSIDVNHFPAKKAFGGLRSKLFVQIFNASECRSTNSITYILIECKLFVDKKVYLTDLIKHRKNKSQHTYLHSKCLFSFLQTQNEGIVAIVKNNSNRYAVCKHIHPFVSPERVQKPFLPQLGHLNTLSSFI